MVLQYTEFSVKEIYKVFSNGQCSKYLPDYQVKIRTPDRDFVMGIVTLI